MYPDQPRIFRRHNTMQSMTGNKDLLKRLKGVYFSHKARLFDWRNDSEVLVVLCTKRNKVFISPL